MPAAGQLEVGFVERGLLDIRRILMEDAEELLGEGLVDLVVAADEEAVRAELVGLTQGHAGVDTVAAGLVVAGRGHTPLVGQAADDDRLPFQGGIEQLLDSREKGVDVDVDDGATSHPGLLKDGIPPLSLRTK